MFPVYIKEPNSKPPGTDVHYIIAKNGIFLHKKNDWVDATVPVKQIAVLDEQSIGVKVLLPHIPSTVMAKVVMFFKAVYEKHKTEAAVLLHFSKEKGWEISIPQQKVSAAKADYDPTERLEGYNCAGTMHSHANMSAFHSGTDIHDEAEQDGIHITIGDLDDPDSFSLDGEVVVNGTRFTLNDGFLEGIKEAEKKPLPYFKNRKFYVVDCPSLNEWVVPEEWMSKVEKRPPFVYKPATIPDRVDVMPQSANRDRSIRDYSLHFDDFDRGEKVVKKRIREKGVKEIPANLGKDVNDAN